MAVYEPPLYGTEFHVVLDLNASLYSVNAKTPISNIYEEENALLPPKEIHILYR